MTDFAPHVPQSARALQWRAQLAHRVAILGLAANTELYRRLNYLEERRRANEAEWRPRRVRRVVR